MPALDHYEGTTSGLNSPAIGVLTITPDDANDLAIMPRAVMVAGVGNVAVIMKDGSSGTLPAFQPGVP